MENRWILLFGIGVCLVHKPAFSSESQKPAEELLNSVRQKNSSPDQVEQSNTRKLSAEEYTARAKLKIDNNDLAGAAEDLLESIKCSSENPTPFSELAYVSLRFGKFQMCVEWATKALKINPNMPEALSNRSTCYAGLRKYEAALIDASHKVELLSNKEKAAALMARAALYSISERCMEAISDTIAASKLDNPVVEQYFNKSKSLQTCIGVYKSEMLKKVQKLKIDVQPLEEQK